MDVPPLIYPSGDPVLIDTIVGQLKSQGTFDQFRKECVADVDTKPAYQNLHQRVETAVAKFLEGQKWRPDMNKNQLRDSLRKHIHELGFLEAGVERIVDQVVNPKVHAVFMPQVEDVVYRVQGIPKPEKKSLPSISSNLGSASKNGGIFNSSVFSQPPPPFLPGLSFLPAALQSHMQKPPPTLADLLPTDLDPVSPESSKGSTEDKEKVKVSAISKEQEDSLDSQLSGFSDLTSHGSEHDINSKEVQKEVSSAQVANEDSHLSKVSSNSRLSFTSSDNKSHGANERDTLETNESEDNQQSVNHATDKLSESPLSQHGNYTCLKTPPHEPEVPVMHYEDQFSKEEEVATTVTDHASEMYEESSPRISLKNDKNNDLESTKVEEDHCCSLKGEELDPQIRQDLETNSLKNEPSTHFLTNEADEISSHHSEESQSSEASENKLQIDEMKDSNSHSEQSVQAFDQVVIKAPAYEGFESKDSSCDKSPSEKIVEASEEARHGFDDSQDALVRPPALPSSPPPPPPDSLSPKSSASFPCEENGVPRTPRWQPTSPMEDRIQVSAVDVDTGDLKLSATRFDDQTHASKDDISQSGSEDMQLAWSPLSVNDNKDEDDDENKSIRRKTDAISDSDFERGECDVQSEQHNEEGKDQDEMADLKNNQRYAENSDKHDDEIQDKYRTKGKSRDDRGRSKYEDRPQKDSSTYSKRYDEKSSRSKDTRERKDSSSRSKHEDRSRSSHHKSDDRRKGDRERSSSSKHKSSRSNERHRHKDKDSKSHNSSREDRDREKSSSSKEKSSSKSYSGDRDRRDRDRKEKEGKDKDRRDEKDRDRSGKDSSKHSEKRRDKDKKEKNSNACRPTNERKSPDPDSNNGSMFGGNQTTGASSSFTNQPKDGSKDESNKGASPNDSDTKSSDSSQSKGTSAELSNATSAPLPFKKRPLHPECSEVDESCGRLILRIKKAKLEPALYKQENKNSLNMEKKSQCPYYSDSEKKEDLSKVKVCKNFSAPSSPLLYFESDWPSKLDDAAFCSFVSKLEQSENLSELSDYSEPETEPKGHHFKIETELYGSKAHASSSVLSQYQSRVKSVQLNPRKGKARQIKRVNNASLKKKNKLKQSQLSSDKREKKEAIQQPHPDLPVLFKSRRERKPNKRYSNDEFTSSFGYEDDETIEELSTSEQTTKFHETSIQWNADSQNQNSIIQGRASSLEHHNPINPSSDLKAFGGRVSKHNTHSDMPHESSIAAKSDEQENLTKEASHCWERPEEDSNSEEENVATGYENELIGTALKNLMMESGLGGPEEASGLDKVATAPQSSQNSAEFGTTTKKQPLSGVKRVGLSRKYKAKANVHSQAVNKIVTSKSPSREEFPLPPSPESDVSASSVEKARVRKAKKAVLGVVVSDAESHGEYGGHMAKKSERVKQHYNSDDLYKPRPLLRYTSKRRQVVADQNGTW